MHRGNIGERLAKDNLAVHRNDREDQRKALAVAVGPSGSNLGPECIIAFAGDMLGLEGGRFGVIAALVVRAMMKFLSCPYGSLPPSARPRGKGRASCPMSYTGERSEPARAGH